MTSTKTIELDDLLNLYTAGATHLGCYKVVNNLGRAWKVENTKTYETGILSVFWDKDEAHLKMGGTDYLLTCFFED